MKDSQTGRITGNNQSINQQIIDFLARKKNFSFTLTLPQSDQVLYVESQ
jgi:hypothetical protein